MSDRVVIDGDMSLTSTIDGEGGAYIRLGQNPVIEPLEVSENGTYSVPEGVDGFNPVIVDTEVDALRSEIDSAIEASGCNPLVEGINTLTAYANETTGTSDTTLSNAVQTLVAGYSGDLTVGEILNYTAPAGDVFYTGTSFANGLSKRPITSFISPTLGTVAYPDYGFERCTKLTRFIAPNFNNQYGNFVFSECTNLVLVDCATTRIGNYDFYRCKALNTLILRGDRVAWIYSVSTSFNGTPFALGGTGGTIYVPASMISSYQSDERWAVFDGYGTITWAALEGSQYESTTWYEKI